jgi:hypothetical protein
MSFLPLGRIARGPGVAFGTIWYEQTAEIRLYLRGTLSELGCCRTWLGKPVSFVNYETS